MVSSGRYSFQACGWPAMIRAQGLHLQHHSSKLTIFIAELCMVPPMFSSARSQVVHRACQAWEGAPT